MAAPQAGPSLERHLEFRDELLRARPADSDRRARRLRPQRRVRRIPSQRVDRFVAAAGRGRRPEVMRFPPLVNRAHFERSGYLKSFPHLAGSVHSFAGDERAHASCSTQSRRAGTGARRCRTPAWC